MLLRSGYVGQLAGNRYTLAYGMALSDPGDKPRIDGEKLEEAAERLSKELPR